MKITELLNSGKILVADGAWGTFLIQKGLQPGECPELWNINLPGEILDIATKYIQAGSDLIGTNSFGANRIKLKYYGLEKQVAEINIAAAEISREAAGNEHIVMGSVGPTGKLLVMGEITEDEVYDIYREQVIALEKGGADAISIETMSDLAEAKIAIQAAKENSNCEVICTMTFEKTPDGSFFTMMGVSPYEMAKVLVSAGADIIGSNCGSGSGIMSEIVREIRSVNKDIPVIIQANAGIPVYQDGKTSYPENPDEMATYINDLVKAGANIIGGCCGTTPEHIERITQIIKKY